MMSFLRDRLARYWLILVALTVFSVEVLASGDGSTAPAIHYVAVIGIAWVKGRMVGLEYMELRHAPPVLRALFEVWAAGVTIAIVVMLIAG